MKLSKDKYCFPIYIIFLRLIMVLGFGAIEVLGVIQLFTSDNINIFNIIGPIIYIPFLAIMIIPFIDSFSVISIDGEHISKQNLIFNIINFSDIKILSRIPTSQIKDCINGYLLKLVDVKGKKITINEKIDKFSEFTNSLLNSKLPQEFKDQLIRMYNIKVIEE